MIHKHSLTKLRKFKMSLNNILLIEFDIMFYPLVSGTVF